ncbi:hypothetical protein M011DRAFT_529949 [Sporormia fimetaria CBS 119925]|uniref:Uncharacterized protein n=1 Tax=Sporormia fimetaria CBS 119925 TaxID=1340428 RepID=A0A6A6UVM4_9PLEO|nr:hypothetical protein M011DRAFT_529949 [Sporormia fimetaria CBS 119925]
MRRSALLAVIGIGVLTSAVPVKDSEAVNTSDELSAQDLLANTAAPETSTKFEILPEYLDAASVWGGLDLSNDSNLTMAASSGAVDSANPRLLVGMYGPNQHVGFPEADFGRYIYDCVNELCRPSGCTNNWCRVGAIFYDAKGSLAMNAHLEIRAGGEYSKNGFQHSFLIAAAAQAYQRTMDESSGNCYNSRMKNGQTVKFCTVRQYAFAKVENHPNGGILGISVKFNGKTTDTRYQCGRVLDGLWKYVSASITPGLGRLLGAPNTETHTTCDVVVDFQNE